MTKKKTKNPITIRLPEDVEELVSAAQRISGDHRTALVVEALVDYLPKKVKACEDQRLRDAAAQREKLEAELREFYALAKKRHP